MPARRNRAADLRRVSQRLSPAVFLRLSREEPFRVFFPLGFIFGALGVLLWPLFLWRGLGLYPAVPHARLMIEGMMGCFLFGFLGTAGPRLLSVPHLSGAELVRLLLAVTGMGAAHLLGWHPLGDTLFLIALLLFVFTLARRFPHRQDSPPPNFILVTLGVCNGLAGAALLAYSEWTSSAPDLYRVGAALLHVGFILLPLLGVAPFFMRRLLETPEAEISPRKWKRDLLIALAVGLIVDLSLVVEVFRPTSPLGWLRCAAAVLYIFLNLPMRGANPLATSLRMSLAALAAALGLIALLPGDRLAALHVLFIGGFGVAVFSVATRVILGHSGRLDLVGKRRGLVVLTLIFLILAMVSRFVADFVPTRDAHLLWGAIAWLLGAGLWGALVLPFVARAEAE